MRSKIKVLAWVCVSQKCWLNLRLCRGCTVMRWYVMFAQRLHTPGGASVICIMHVAAQWVQTYCKSHGQRAQVVFALKLAYVRLYGRRCFCSHCLGACVTSKYENSLGQGEVPHWHLVWDWRVEKDPAPPENEEEQMNELRKVLHAAGMHHPPPAVRKSGRWTVLVTI